MFTFPVASLLTLFSHQLPSMSMMKERSMEIAFCGGRKVRLQFPVQATDESMAARLEEVLKLPSLSISAEDVLYVIPTSAIEMITVSPAPKKLPSTVIRCARLLESKPATRKSPRRYPNRSPVPLVSQAGNKTGTAKRVTRSTKSEAGTVP